MKHTPRLLFFAAAALFSFHVSALDLYVAPTGKDSNPGTKDQPLASLTGARDAIRSLRTKGPLAEGVTVLIQPGTYPMVEPLVLTPADAATAASPVVFTAAPGGKVAFIGGVEIGGFKQVNDKLWKTTVPQTTAFGWQFEQLYVNGRRAVRARTPNVGQYFNVKAVEETIIERGQGRAPAFAVQQVLADPAQTAPLLQGVGAEDLKDALLIFYHNWDNTRKFVSRYDAATQSFLMTGEGLRPWNKINDKSRFFVENYRGALDAPGEWFLEKDGTLYYVPAEGQQPETTRFQAPVLDKFIVLQGAPGRYLEHITFKDLAFQVAGYTTPRQGNEPAQAAAPIESVVMADYARHITFDNVEIAHTGLGAIWLRESCSDNKISHCYLHDLGAGGVKVGPLKAPAQEALVSRNNVIDNNIIRSGGWVFPCAVGVAIFHASDNQLTHNEIADLRYSGVSVGWVWGYGNSVAKRNKIQYNHIHHLGWGDLSDMGGVYTLGKSEGTEVSNNVIHHIYSLTYGGWGLYTDEGSTGIVMENNLVYACKSSGFHQHYGRDNIIRNNIFAFNIKAQLQATRVEDHNSFNFTNNIVYFDSGTLLSSRWSSIRLHTDRNLYWDERARDVLFDKLTFKQWQQAGKDRHSRMANPGFVNPHGFDFRLKNNRAVRKVGFKPFDYTQAGVYGSPDWVQLARFDARLARQFDAIVAANEVKPAVKE